VPASIVRYRLAERAELPGEWQYHQLKKAISSSPLWVGMLVMLIALFGIFPQLSMIFTVTVGFTALGLSIIIGLALAVDRALKVHSEETLAVRLLGKFQDIGGTDQQATDSQVVFFPDKSRLNGIELEVDYLSIFDKNALKLGNEIDHYSPRVC